MRKWSLFAIMMSALLVLALATTDGSAQNQPLSENDTPVFRGKVVDQTTATATWPRLFYGLGVVLFTSLALFTVGRWWTRRFRKDLGGNRIRILNQFHLGPKKNLAIIQVAGETILIGITEHHISLIKTLALIDDEVAGVDQAGFGHTLNRIAADGLSGLSRVEGNESEESMTDEFVIDHVKERVADRLKEMRKL